MQRKECKLTELPPGAKARVSRITAEIPLKNKLADLGLLPSAEIQYLFPAPAGDPRAYRICGAIIALRNRDGSKILVQPEEKE